MKPFQEQFKDRIDAADGSVVLREIEYKQIVADILEAAYETCAVSCGCRADVERLWKQFKAKR